MRKTHFGEGGDLTPDLVSDFLARFGMSYMEGVVEEPLLNATAIEAQAIYKSAIAGNTDKDILFVPDSRIVHIAWRCDESEDEQLVERVREITGLECGSVLRSGRALLSAAGFEYSPDYLTIFRTRSCEQIRLHKDNGVGVEPNPDFFRDILHLRGKRRVGIAGDYGLPRYFNIKPGDAYELFPEVIYHATVYSDDSLAIYVQGYLS